MTIIRLSMPLFVASAVLLGAAPVHGQDADAPEPPVPVELFSAIMPIPEIVAGNAIKSWSLFLICDPGWLLEASLDDLAGLYNEFLALGDALGPEHAAVWFWARDPFTDLREIQSAIDVVRATAFCSRLELPPSEGPYLVVTTDYPGEGFSSDLSTVNVPENMAVVRLSEVDDMDVTLRAVVDAAFTSNLQSLDQGSEAYWRGWQRAFALVQNGISNVARRLKIKIKTVFFEVEVTGG